MIQLKKLVLFLVMVLLASVDFGQGKIPYGSNNGRYVSIFNKKIYYEEYGKGTPLLLLQGGMKGIKDFAACIPELQKHYRVIAPDDPGQGRSQMLDTMTYDLLADYVSKLIDILKLDSAYVMGWSDGGIAALILASKRPEKIKKVIASGANYMKSGMVANDTLQLIPPEYEPPAEDKKWVDDYFIANRKDWKKIVNDRKIMWDQTYYFPATVFNKLAMPVMIVSGDRDIVKLEHTVEMYRMIKGAQLCILPNTTHGVFTESAGLISEIAIKFFGK